MLGIGSTKILARLMGTEEKRLRHVVEHRDEFTQELVLTNQESPHKERLVFATRGALRLFQTRLYRNALLPRLNPSLHSHGGIRGRSILTNARAHIHSEFVFRTDIRNFFPSVHRKRVYEMFVGRLQCSPDVASLCTKLTTCNHHLAQGLVTSPILADQALAKVDARIAGACQKAGLVYTRYVDDVTISGAYDLEKSGIPRLVERILAQDGFEVNPQKHKFGRLSDGTPITNLRIKRGRLDAQREYIQELSRQLRDAVVLAGGGEGFQGPYFTRDQILGRIFFVCHINPHHRRILMRRYRAIDWRAVAREAEARGLIAYRKIIIEKPNKLTAKTMP